MAYTGIFIPAEFLQIRNDDRTLGDWASETVLIAL